MKSDITWEEYNKSLKVMRELCAKIVENYAEQRLDAIRNSGSRSVVPQPDEDIVAALRVAAKRIREVSDEELLAMLGELDGE